MARAKQTTAAAEEAETFDLGDEPAVSVELAAEPAGPVVATHYTVSTLAELDNYQCTECPFATRDRALIETHVRTHR